MQRKEEVWRADARGQGRVQKCRSRNGGEVQAGYIRTAFNATVGSAVMGAITFQEYTVHPELKVLVDYSMQMKVTKYLYIINSMEQSPRELNSRPAGQAYPPPPIRSED
jgi:hypothetical protein